MHASLLTDSLYPHSSFTPFCFGGGGGSPRPFVSSTPRSVHFSFAITRLIGTGASLHDRSKLQDAVPASPFEEVEATAVQQLGRPLSELFASVETEALASASVAQVHRCRLKDGREAVIKVSGEGEGGGEIGLTVRRGRVSSCDIGTLMCSVSGRHEVGGGGLYSGCWLQLAWNWDAA